MLTLEGLPETQEATETQPRDSMLAAVINESTSYQETLVLVITIVKFSA